MPDQADPHLLVGFESRDDAGVFVMPDGSALVQTLDFFTPIVDDPYAYGQIAAANSLSDVYAMGGTPITAMNIACFDPSLAPSDVWASIFRGMAEKCLEAGVTVVGGHTVKDTEPKFGLSVTGKIDPHQMLTNRGAQQGQGIWLSKPIGSGIITNAAKAEACDPAHLQAAIQAMSHLNQEASKSALASGATGGTDITGFGLMGHLWNIARESQVILQISLAAIPYFDGLEGYIKNGYGGSGWANREALLPHVELQGEQDWRFDAVFDPQTSGGLAVTSHEAPVGYVQIGKVLAGQPAIQLIP